MINHLFLYFDDLLDSVWEAKNRNLPVSFASGLTGMAWGIEYLLQNSFVSGQGNAVCREIDSRIMNSDIRRISPDFIENELEGLLHYILIRIKGSIMQQTAFPFDELYCRDLLQTLHLIRKTNSISQTGDSLINQLFGYLQNKNSLDYIPNLITFIDEKDTVKREKDILSAPSGIKNGLAGHLYKLINRRQP